MCCALLSIATFKMWIVPWLLLVLATSVNGSELNLYGEIQSQNYPQDYPDDVHQTWNIKVPEGFKIRIYFTHVDIEPSENCEYDYLKISAEDQQLGLICGRLSTSPGGNSFIRVTESPFNVMTVTFHSDFSNQERFTGFMAYYVAVDINECEDSHNGEEACTHTCNNYIGGFICTCRPGYFLQEDQRTCGVNCSGDVYTDLAGVITSPGYPETYPENSRCEYKVELEDGYQVVLHFEDLFDVEKGQGANCSWDVLKVEAGNNTFGPFCEKPTNPIETGINIIKIKFHTDGFGDNKGWKIRYKASARPCPMEVPRKSKIEPVKPKYVFKDVVKITCLEGYEVPVIGNTIKSFTSTCLSDGKWSESLDKCQPVDCGPPEEIENANYVYLTESQKNTYEAKIQYICEEPYYKIKEKGNGIYQCDAHGMWRNPDIGTVFPTCIPVCGNLSNPPHPIQRIIKGELAEVGNFPWQVFFEIPRGGGALIGEQWVLTAAHVADNEGLKMYIGTINVSSEKLEDAIELEIDTVFIHPNYTSVPDNEKQYNYNNDIALIKLKKKVKMGHQISPICIPNESEEFELQHGRLGFISGWGRTEKNFLSRRLRYAEIPIEDMKNCRYQISQKKNPESSKYTFTDNMFCAGIKGMDSCQGDSGGAYAFKSDDNTYFVGGIVSWGVDCGSYGFYTKMKNYIGWLNKTVIENSDA